MVSRHIGWGKGILEDRSVMPMNKKLTYLETEPLTAEREWVSDGMAVLHASVRVPRPVPSAGGVFRRVRRYYQLQCQAFFRYCQRELLPQAAAEYAAALACSRPLPDFHAELDYRVTYNEGGLWSLYTQSREVGPGGTFLVRRGDTWDLGAGYPVPSASFFSGGLRKTLLSAAEVQIQRRQAAGAGVWREDWRHGLRRYYNPANYYLTEDGFAFFYPMLSIAPASAGIPVFLLPYSDAAGRPQVK